ncbi:MAG TPA: M67 family metallopeptidase [Magnetovibrio sp.]
MIRIAQAHLERIHGLGEQAYPGECCGLLVGHSTPDGNISVTKIVPSANVASPPGDDRFEVDPKVRFDTMRELANSDEAIVGHYHSHPDQPARPSQTDLSMAFEPELVWLITAVTQGKAERTLAWRLNRDTGTIRDVAMEIGEPA